MIDHEEKRTTMNDRAGLKGQEELVDLALELSRRRGKRGMQLNDRHGQFAELGKVRCPTLEQLMESLIQSSDLLLTRRWFITNATGKVALTHSLDRASFTF